MKSLVYVDDLISIIIKCLANRSKVNAKKFNVASDNPLSISDLLRALSRKLQIKPFYFSLNLALFKFITKILCLDLNAFCSSNTVDNSAVKKCLHQNFLPIKTTLHEIKLK